MDHYAGPARIIKQVGKRSFLIEYRNAKGSLKVFQRDAGMLSLLHPARVNFELRTQYYKHMSLINIVP